MIKCPHCGRSGKHIAITEINVLMGNTYEEYYHCSCGHTFVALIPRQTANAFIHKIIRNGGFERWE